MKNIIKSHWKYLTICLLFVFIAGFAGTYVQFLKGELLDAALEGVSAGVFRLAIAFFAAIAVEMASFYGYDYFRGRFSVANKKSLRSLYFDWLLMRSPVEAMTVQQGEFVAQYTDQIDQVNENYLDNIPLLIEISSKTLIVSAALFWLDYRVALLTLFLLTMPLYIPKLIEKKLQNAKNESIDSFQKHLGNIVEWLSGFELIKNYSIEKVIVRKFRESNEEVSDKLFRFKKVTYLSKTITALLSYMSHFVVIVTTAALVLNGDFSAGDFFSAVGLIDQLSYPIIAVSAYLQKYLSTKLVAKKLESLFEQAPAGSERTMEISQINSVAFRHVCFGYEAASPILNDFSLKVNAGEKCMITGQSGSGKSTSMNLLLGYYKPQSGEILINDSNAFCVKQLNEKIAIMRQDPVLFNDTLRNNLTMYRDMRDDELIALLQKLNLHKFATPEGLDSMIREGGSNLSGGERKRIALARTLLRKAPITIIDEPLANVDSETAEKIENILTELSGGIVFVITHHFSDDKKKAFAKEFHFSHSHVEHGGI